MRAIHVSALAAALLLLPADAGSAAAGVKFVDEFDLSSSVCGFGKTVRARTSVDGNPLTVGRVTSSRGFGAHAESAVAFALNGKVDAFDARVGIDADCRKANTWTGCYVGARFRVWTDGRIAFDSDVMREIDGPKDVHVALSGVREVVLETTTVGGWLSCVGTNGDWLDARFAVGAEGDVAIVDARGRAPQLGTLTPPAKDAPQFNGPEIWGVRPGHEVIFRVPVSGARPMRLAAEGLPSGVTFDAGKGVLRGVAPSQKGDYAIRVSAENAAGKASRVVTLRVGDTLCLTPPMGWNSWNYCCWTLTQEDAMRAARALDSTGLADHGWAYVNLDDWWQMNNSGNARSKTRTDVQGPARDANGAILPNRGFPDMKAFTALCHDLGLKAGIYSSPGALTCGECEGSLGHEAQDAATYAEWGFDYIKYDWCSYQKVFLEEMTGRMPRDDDYAKPYRKMGQLLAAQNRDIVFSLCESGVPGVQKWGREVGGNLWRIGGDMKDCWMWMRSSLEGSGGHYDSWKVAGPGFWGDPDMMLIGLQRSFGTVHPTYLSPNELYTHVSLWSLMCAPLLLGCDLEKLTPFEMSLLVNDEVIAVNQDRLGKPARRVAVTDAYEVWLRPLANGDFAMGIVNLYPLAREISFGLGEIGLSGRFAVRDLWRQADEPHAEGAYAVTVPPHATKFIRLRRSESSGSHAKATDGDCLRIATDKASLEVALQGGRVMSFKVQGDEILWRPREWRLGGDRWAHGGIPLCWPWFGASGPDPAVAHGFAWKRTFALRSRSESPERCELVLGLSSDEDSRRVWPHDFDLEYRIVLTDRLQLQLITRNVGKEPFLLTAGFHPYFALGDRDRAWVTATDGMRFCDSRETTEYGKVWNGNLRLLSSMDHVFVEPQSLAFHEIVDPVLSRRIGVASSGAARLVVWNPGAEGPADETPAPGALAKGDWRHLICVEPAILWREAARTVAPGALHVLSAEIAREAYR